jgi:hypothetical protein
MSFEGQRPPSSTRHLYARLDQDNEMVPMVAAAAAASPTPSPVAGWTCSTCTFQNTRMDAPTCEMCQSTRPVAASSVSSVASQGEGVSAPLIYSHEPQIALAVPVATPVAAAIPVNAAGQVVLPVALAANDLVLVTPSGTSSNPSEFPPFLPSFLPSFLPWH